jgi:hypothetical protein
MKKQLLTLSFLLIAGLLSFGQSTDQLASNCAINAGPNAKYLKDFRVKLGKTANLADFRYKADFALWKNTKYRFTLCNSDDSKGQLILTIKDESNKVILSSFDSKSGKTYPYVDFTCNKSGKYQLNYDFTEGQQGSGIGVISMIK